MDVDDDQVEKEEEKQPELPKEDSTNIITQPTFPPATNTQSVKNTNNNAIGLSSNHGRMHLDEITSQVVEQASIKGPAGTKKSRQLNKP